MQWYDRPQLMSWSKARVRGQAFEVVGVVGREEPLSTEERKPTKPVRVIQTRGRGRPPKPKQDPVKEPEETGRTPEAPEPVSDPPPVNVLRRRG